MIDKRLLYEPDVVSPPGETLQDVLHEREITQKALAFRMGRPLKTINEIIKGKAAITKETALEFEKVLGTPADFWLRRESKYREYLARVEEDKNLESWLPWLDRLPVKELMEVMAIPKLRMVGSNKKTVLKALLCFFGVASPEGWRKIYAEPELVSYRRTRVEQSDFGAISSWLRLGELEAEKVKVADFNIAKFKAALEEIRSLTVEDPQTFLPIMKELCRDSGVILSLVPSIRRAHVSGVARWLGTNKALIQLSLYGKANDRFWFTFFHEAAHILQQDKKEVFLDDSSGEAIDSAKEIEANKFAANHLIPAKFQDELPGLRSALSIQRFSKKLGIHPGIVVGRLQHEKHVDVKWFNKLKDTYRWT
jgi:HTH-type transcriptional regulator/antitoxin HigA